MNKSILLIEDEKIMRISLADMLKSEGYAVFAAADGASGCAALEQGDFSLVITDVRLPDVSGIAILKAAIKDNPAMPVIVMTAYGSINDAVEAMRLGAFDYITKPFSLEEMLIVVKRALEKRLLTEENIRLKKDLSDLLNFPNIIGESQSMQHVLAMLEKVSKTDSTVLILGESGTGKELIASTIHYQSGRRDKPLIRVNCAALPDTLIESELFGYEKGAFTGAAGRKPGRFEMADSGTIFLDEIGDLPQLTQTKLLRVLEERSFERLGGTEPLQVDVRVIAATNKNLAKEIKKGSFREDLYYRLNVIPIELPPLRSRHDDIPLLIDKFLRQFNDRYGMSVSFDQGAVTELCGYSFPGNVRELINIVERCVTLSGSGVVRKRDLPPHILKDRSVKTRLLSLSEVAADAEKGHIMRILKVTRGNRSQAADILGISRKTLWEKMGNYGLDF
ncbi:MAG: sigma-54 dependent transcriptional regulator [Desulfobulbaceae bacterium]|nr:sigma-54 dependent transcriptional regulator [Desulfobulbaceae bacterium]